jgi:hypothetical protein
MSDANEIAKVDSKPLRVDQVDVFKTAVCIKHGGAARSNTIMGGNEDELAQQPSHWHSVFFWGGGGAWLREDDVSIEPMQFCQSGSGKISTPGRESFKGWC